MDSPRPQAGGLVLRLYIQWESPMELLVSSTVLEKLRGKHGVTIAEVEQCFDNRLGQFLQDKRERHRTSPPTQWFIAPTDKGRLLKVVFIRTDGSNVLKSAFEPTEVEKTIYVRHALK